MILFTSLLFGTSLYLLATCALQGHRVRRLAQHPQNLWARLFDKILGQVKAFLGDRQMRKGEGVFWEEAAFSLAFHLRAGEPPAQALRSVAEEGDDFARSCFMRAYRRYESGSPLPEAINDQADRVPQMSYLAAILDLGLSSGGDLPALLCHASESLRRRRLFHKEAAARLVEARFTAYLLAGLPWLVGYATFRQDPGLWHTVMTDSRAQILMVVGAGLWVLGSLVTSLLIRNAVPAEKLAGKGGDDR